MESKRTIADIESHSWGYIKQEIKDYLLAAEKFYQLFSALHDSPSLTPYMIKLIDHIPQFMKDTVSDNPLPV